MLPLVLVLQEHHLRSHQFTHTGLRPYSCPVCGRSFNQRANMQRHLLIHKAERSYKCDYCDKTFTQPQTLKAHMVVHADHKPYKCTLCGESAARSQQTCWTLKAAFWLWPVVAIMASVQPESGRVICTRSDFLHPIQFGSSKKGLDHHAQNQPGSDLDDPVRFWPNAFDSGSNQCA